MQGARPPRIFKPIQKRRGKKRRMEETSSVLLRKFPVPVPCVIVLTLWPVMGAEHWSLHSGNILVTRVDISAWLDLIRDTNTPT